MTTGLKKADGVAKAVGAAGRFVDLDQDKLRGGYYTPSHVAQWLCAWAIRKPSDDVLEPSCGDGAFLEAAASRFLKLGLDGPKIADQLTGVEILDTEADYATMRLRPAVGLRARDIVHKTDFFGWWQSNSMFKFDAVVGNPPFIRYQSFPEPHRARAMQIMKLLGLTPNKLTNIWVPFVVASAACLRPGGRLALVLPAEILQVTYAAQLRSYLTDRFKRIDIVACNELFFDKAEQEVVLLLADGALPKASASNACRVAMTETGTVAAVTETEPKTLLARAQLKEVRHDSEKWLKYFLSAREIEFMRELREALCTTSMKTHAEIDVGVVTGKNEFFVLTLDQVKDLGLQGHTLPLVSRSAHLKGSRVGKADWNKLSSSGDRVHLLNITDIPAGSIGKSILQYIRFGEDKDFHKGYKCSIRKPWYTVPSLWVPDGFMFRQIYDFPRMVLNTSGATSTDTIHRLTSMSAKPERIIANSYTWLTAASAEIEGRSYGGGVLELEPTEAERLLMPSKLNGAMPLAEVDKLIRAGSIDIVLEANARIVLMEHMGLSATDCALLKGIWTKMRDRRMGRQRGSQKKSKHA